MAFHDHYIKQPQSQPWLQKKCSCGGTCSKCRQQNNHENLQNESIPGSVHEVLKSPGHEIDKNTRHFMESKFGQDFSNVKLHTGENASRSAEEMNAMAYTVGQHIVIGDKHYLPGSPANKGLLAHELTHTLQQQHADSSIPDKLKIGEQHDRFEQEATNVANKIVSPGAPSPPITRGSFQISKAPPETPTAPELPELGSNFTAEQKGLLRQARSSLNPKKGGIVGVLIAEDGRTFEFESGGGQGFSSHIEGKATAKMNELGITKATLLVEMEPCQICDRSVYDPEKGPEEPLRSTATGKELDRQTPKINSALPRGSVLTVVGPESTGIYSGTGPPRPRVVLPDDETPKTGTKEKATAEPEAGSKGTRGLGSRRGSVSFPPVTIPGTKIGPKPAGGGRHGGLKKGSLKGAAGNAALNLAMLTATLIEELIIRPKLEEWMAELEEAQRQRMQKRIQKIFNDFISAHVMKVLKICYLKDLKKLEAEGKQAYINISLSIVLEDTSNRIQIFSETPPESVFDIEVDDVKYVDAVLSDTPIEPSTGEMTRCENCGTFSRGKTFVSNNPLWEQPLKFSIEAPTSQEIIAEFGDELSTDESDCAAEKGCFIATACYGSLYAPEVQMLRNFRDQKLLTSKGGRCLVRLYYFISPSIAKYLRRNQKAKTIVRKAIIAPIVRRLKAKNFATNPHHS